jgi:membrane protein
MSSARGLRARVLGAVPGSLRKAVENAGRHHTLTLAAGLAFYGIISIGPAVGVGFGLVHLLVSPEALDALTNLLEDSLPHQLGLADLVDQMEDRAGRYAGIGLAVLLWPATTLASGWARALDAIAGFDATPGVRGLRGRLSGLLPGGILVAALFLLFAGVTFGVALFGGDRVLLLVGILVGGVGLQFLFALAIYRWLPSRGRPWQALWKGALLSTIGVIASTALFGFARALGEGLAERYPPSLTTAVVLGLWLYGANTALLLGAEYNEVHLSSDVTRGG